MAGITGTYDKVLEKEVVDWMCDVTELPSPLVVGMDKAQPEVVQKWLKDGQVLCKLINKLQPGSVPNVHDTSTIIIPVIRTIKEKDNIGLFLYACAKYGIPDYDLFKVFDLHEGLDMANVLHTMVTVAKKTGKHFSLSSKMRTCNSSSKDRISLIGLQMGPNQCDQYGMTPYCLGRQLTHL